MNTFPAHESDAISENDLLALHLRELPPARAQRVRRELDHNPALAAESAAIAATLAAFDNPPVAVGKAALDRNWAALRPLLVGHVQPVPAWTRWRWPALAGALAAVVAATALLLWEHSPHDASVPALVAGMATGPHAGPQAGTQAGQASTSGVAGGGSFPGDGNAAAPQRGFESGDANAPRVSGGVFHTDARHSPIHQLGLAPWPPAAGLEEGAQGLPLASAPLTSAPLTSAPLTSAPLTSAPLTVTPLTMEPLSPAPLTANPSLAEEQHGAFTGRERGQPVAGARAPAHPAKGAAKKCAGHTTDVALALGGSFIPRHNSTVAETEPASQSNTNSVVALGSFHQQYRPGVGYRVTASYTRTDFEYSYFNSGLVNSRIFEIAGTYVVEGPHHGRVSSKADVGGGLMAFLPTSDPNASYVYRGAAVLGASVDIALTKHLSVRGAYRAQLFKGPNFRYRGGTVPVMVSLRESNEPSLGIVYGFGKR